MLPHLHQISCSIKDLWIRRWVSGKCLPHRHEDLSLDSRTPMSVYSNVNVKSIPLLLWDVGEGSRTVRHVQQMRDSSWTGRRTDAQDCPLTAIYLTTLLACTYKSIKMFCHVNVILHETFFIHMRTNMYKTWETLILMIIILGFS